MHSTRASEEMLARAFDSIPSITSRALSVSDFTAFMVSVPIAMVNAAVRIGIHLSISALASSRAALSELKYGRGGA